MLKISKTDTLVEIIEQIWEESSSHIILVFPFWHPIIRNKTSLWIIQSQSWDKKITIVSYDPIGRKLAQSLWIPFSYIKNKKFLEKKSSMSIMQHNYSVVEYIQYQWWKILSYIPQIWWISWKKNAWSHWKKEILSLNILFFILLISILIFIFIYYFAISKTYINITPEIEVKKEAFNFVFKEDIQDSILWWNKNINITKKSLNIELREEFWSTWVNSENTQNTQGEITLYNYTDSNVELIINSRLNSPQWVEFLLKENVFIPAAIQDNFWNISPGITLSNIESTPFDIYWKYSGENANIVENTRLTFPGLPWELQEQIYAINQNAFIWATWEYNLEVSSEDIESAKELFYKKIQDYALEKAQDLTHDININDGSFYKILRTENAIKYSDVNISEISHNLWDISDNFEIFWSINIQFYIFNTEPLIQKLRNRINERIIPSQETVSYINDESLRLAQIIYSNTDPFEFKGTYEIEYFSLYNFSWDENIYVRDIQNKVLWKNKEDGLRILINDEKISNAEISIRPFFLKVISKIPNNIIVNINEN